MATLTEPTRVLYFYPLRVMEVPEDKTVTESGAETGGRGRLWLRKPYWTSSHLGKVTMRSASPPVHSPQNISLTAVCRMHVDFLTVKSNHARSEYSQAKWLQV